MDDKQEPREVTPIQFFTETPTFISKDLRAQVHQVPAVAHPSQISEVSTVSQERPVKTKSPLTSRVPKNPTDSEQ